MVQVVVFIFGMFFGVVAVFFGLALNSDMFKRK